MGGHEAVSGVLYGLGVGPGDPELVTLKAVRLARAAPVLAYAAPETGDSMARAIMAPHLASGQIEIVIRMPLAVDRFPSGEVFDRAAHDIAQHLDAGRDVAALCLGDPFLYGSFMYLFARLAGRFQTLIVPGVSSIAAASASLGMALAARNDAFAVVPAPLEDAAIERLLAASDGAALVKLGRHFARMRDLLRRIGLAGKARYIERASQAGQRIVRLDDVDPASVPYFSLIVVHRRGEAWR